MNDSNIFDEGGGESGNETTGIDSGSIDASGGLQFRPNRSELSRLVEKAEQEVHATTVTETLQRTQAGHQAKAALKELYDDDFDFDTPPDSLDRYERVLALRELEEAAIANGKRESAFADGINPDGLPNVQHAVQVVSIMESYGELAEHNLARIAGATVARAEVRESAAASLESVRADASTDSHDSLREALAAWLRPGDR